MSAAEVIALHSICPCGEWAEDIEQHAAHILDALKAAGYAVVEVVPLSELRHGFALEVRRGRILDHGPLDGYAPEDARQFAAALLAAADAAEHPGTPVEASRVQS